MAVDATTAFGPRRTQRADIQAVSDGLIAQTFARSAMTGGTILVGGTAYFSSMPLAAGDVVSSIVICVTTAGVAMTLSKVGLYDTAGNRLAVSADQGTAWETSGYKAAAMTTPYTVPTTGVYYTAVIAAGGTNAIVGRTAMVIPAVSGMALSPGAVLFGSETGQTDLDPTATITASSTSFYHWMGVR
jgi:hypothetical protein